MNFNFEFPEQIELNFEHDESDEGEIFDFSSFQSTGRKKNETFSTEISISSGKKKQWHQRRRRKRFRRPREFNSNDIENVKNYVLFEEEESESERKKDMKEVRTEDENELLRESETEKQKELLKRGWEKEREIERTYNFWNLSHTSMSELVNNTSKKPMNDRKEALQYLKKFEGMTCHYSYRGPKKFEISDELSKDKDFAMDCVSIVPNSLKFFDPDLKDDKDVVLQAVQKLGFSLQHASMRLRDDEDVVLAASKCCSGFQFASDRKKDNEAIALQVVCMDGYNLRDVSVRLRNSLNIVRKAVESPQNFHSFKYAGDSIKNNYDFVLEMVKERGFLWGDASEDLRNDKSLFREALNSKVPLAVLDGCIGDALKDCKESALIAVKEDGFFVRCFADNLKNDPDIVFQAVKTSGLEVMKFCGNGSLKKLFRGFVEHGKSLLMEFGDSLIALKGICEDFERLFKKGDHIIFKNTSTVSKTEMSECIEEFSRDFVSFLLSDLSLFAKCVESCSGIVKFLPDSMKNDRSKVINMVRVNPGTIKYFPKFKDDRDVVIEALRNFDTSMDMSVLRNIVESWKNDEGIVLEAVKCDGWSVQYASESLKNDRIFVRKAVEISGRVIQELPCSRLFRGQKLLELRNLFIIGVRTYPHCLKFAPEEVKDDRECVFLAIDIDGTSLRYASDRLRDDLEIYMAAITNDSDAVVWAGKGLRKMSKLLELVCSCHGSLERALDDWVGFDDFKSKQKVVNEDPKIRIVEKKVVEMMRLNPYRRNIIYGFRDENLKDDDEEKKRIENFSFNDLEVYRIVGRGAYARTYVCRSNGMKGVFVAKVYTDIVKSKEYKLDMLKRDSLSLPYHKNVVTVLSSRIETIDCRKLPDYESYWKEEFGGITSAKSGILLMKFHFKTLEDYMRERSGVFKNDEIIKILIGILEGAQHLHKNMIVHRDLHTENIFIDEINGRVWIGDFGCVLDLRKNPMKFLVKRDDQCLYEIYSGNSTTFRNGGYENCKPPEIKNSDIGSNEYYNFEKYDLYSIGFCGNLLIEHGDRESEGERGLVRDPELVKIVKSLLEPNCETRIGFEESITILKSINRMDRNREIGRCTRHRELNRKSFMHDCEGGMDTFSDDYRSRILRKMNLTKRRRFKLEILM